MYWTKGLEIERYVVSVGRKRYSITYGIDGILWPFVFEGSVKIKVSRRKESGRLDRFVLCISIVIRYKMEREIFLFEIR